MINVNYATFEIFKRVDRNNIPLCTGNFILKKEKCPDIKVNLIDIGIWTATINNEKDYQLYIDNIKIDIPTIKHSEVYKIVI